MENIVGKGENAGYHHFLHFQSLLLAFFPRGVFFGVFCSEEKGISFGTVIGVTFI